MKRILILGAGEYQVPLIESAKKMGLFTIVVSPTGGYPGLNITDKAYFFDVRDKNKILEIAKKEVIDGVTTDQTDIAVSTVAYIAEKLNLAGIGFQVSKLFTDKYLMREKCKSAGIPTLKYTLVDTVREAENFCSVAGYPVVLKPVDNQGSRGVYKIHDNNELEKYFDDSRHFSSNKKVLIEEFIDGLEYVANSLTIDFKYQNLIIGDSSNFSFKNNFVPRQRLFPTIQPIETRNKILELDKKVIKVFNLKNGITHAEYIIDKKTKQVYLLEIAARGGGVYISSDLIPLLTNLNSNTFLLKNALGEEFQYSIQNVSNIAVGYIAFYLPAGEVMSLSGIEEVDKLKEVIKHNLHSIKLNQQIESLKNKTARKIILIKSSNRTELDSIIERLKIIIKITVKTKDGMSGAIWD